MKYYALFVFKEALEPDPKLQICHTSVSFYAGSKIIAEVILATWIEKHYDFLWYMYNRSVTEQKCYLSTNSNKMLRVILNAQGIVQPEYQYNQEQSAALREEYDELLPPTPFNEREQLDC